MKVQVHEFVDPTSKRRLALEVAEVPQMANWHTWRPETEELRVPVTACIGPLSDVFRTSFFDPLSDFPPQEAGASEAEFYEFIGRVRKMSDADFLAMPSF